MIKDIFTRYASSVLVLLSIAAAVFLGFSYYRNHETLKAEYAALLGTQEKYVQVTANLAKLQVDYDTQAALAKKVAQDFSEVSKAKDEQIKMLSSANHVIKATQQSQGTSDFIFKSLDGKSDYSINEVRIAGESSPPVGYVLLKNDGSVQKGNYGFTIQVKTLEVQDAGDGKVRVFSKAFLTLDEDGLADKDAKLVKWKGVQYPLSITGGDAVVDPTQTKAVADFIWWAPHLNIGINAGADSAGGYIRPELNFSVAGFGKHHNNLDWKFLQFGIGTDSKIDVVDFHLIIFSYRPLPGILPNTYIGPGVGTSHFGTNYFLNMSLGF